jgi:gluconolactonase
MNLSFPCSTLQRFAAPISLRMRTSPSQPSSDRTNLALLGRINRLAEHDREDAMTRQKQRDQDAALSRRTLVQGFALGAATFAGAGSALAQTGPAAPPTTITTPPRDFGPNGAPTTYFWDPDVVTVDPSFNDLAQPNTAIKRLYTGLLWAEGPAWSAQGRYLLWSDIPNNRQMRWSEDDGRVSVFRSPSNNSNGNSFDFQGRQLSCEH